MSLRRIMRSISIPLLCFYGVFLIVCGIASVIFIGKKAKTAVISGGTSGSIALLLAYFMFLGKTWALPCGLFLSFALFCVFAWRATKTLFKVFELIPNQHEELEGKGIAFLIISLLAVVSLVVLLLLLMGWLT